MIPQQDVVAGARLSAAYLDMMEYALPTDV